MKKILLPTFCLLLSVMLIAVLPTEADSAIYDDTVRLHILAESDSREDQELKLFIRDKILEKYSDMLSPAGSADDAKALISMHIEDIERDCNLWISEHGADYAAKAELCWEWYGTREYADFTLPSGKYLSLKILLGNGSGQNWWCVMYPPLCLDVATDERGGYSKEENSLISDSGYTVKFKLLELTSYFFKRSR
ncbi:MAG: stage II sporulation protein R [Clostridia bacterium]|nr:stage II sporulation protein R [Clostridia bacterium]